MTWTQLLRQQPQRKSTEKPYTQADKQASKQELVCIRVFPQSNAAAAAAALLCSLQTDVHTCLSAPDIWAADVSLTRGPTRRSSCREAEGEKKKRKKRTKSREQSQVAGLLSLAGS